MRNWFLFNTVNNPKKNHFAAFLINIKDLRVALFHDRRITIAFESYSEYLEAKKEWDKLETTQYYYSKDFAIYWSIVSKFSGNCCDFVCELP